jgi:peptidoglycan hydrolase-like protein with peptidoglycan-binding domain
MGHRTRRIAATIVALAAIVAGMTIVVARPASADNSYRITLDMSECGVMAVGVTGTCIISLQSWLNIFDQAGLAVDGDFGPATEAAVREFQRRHGLVPDGRFGDASRNALRGVYQDMIENSVATPSPAPEDLSCNTATGVHCDIGGAVPGFNGGWMQTLACAGVGGAVGALTGPLAGGGANVFCDVVLQ